MSNELNRKLIIECINDALENNGRLMLLVVKHEGVASLPESMFNKTQILTSQTDSVALDIDFIPIVISNNSTNQIRIEKEYLILDTCFNSVPTTINIYFDYILQLAYDDTVQLNLILTDSVYTDILRGQVRDLAKSPTKSSTKKPALRLVK